MQKKIIFISGWGFNADIFNDLASNFENFDIYSLDSAPDKKSIYPGYNPSSDKKSILVGWSLGGLAALQLCSAHPESFSHLILIASTPRFMRDDNWKGISRMQADKQLSSAKINMQKYQQQFLRLAIYPGNNKQVAQTHMYTHDNENLLPQLHSLFHTDMRDEFSKLTIPVMQIVAENDMIVRLEQSTQSSQLLNHTIHTIPQAGHMFLKTHTYEVSTRIKEFIC